MSNPHAAAEVNGATVEVTGADLSSAAMEALGALADDDVAQRLARQDVTLWGPDAREEASKRLGWLNLPRSSRDLLPRLRELREQLQAEGLDRVVLSGMGGSSLAPEVIAATTGVPLVVLDTTDPAQVARAMSQLERTVVVVASKSGGTIETDSHRRAFEAAFRDAGIDPATRMIAVTDPGSPLEKLATESGYRAVFLADPDVGGRYSALSAFGLVPTALAGVDVAGLLDDAAGILDDTGVADLPEGEGADQNNPGLMLGASLGGAARAGRDKVVLADFGSDQPGFGDWAEQLLAESTGKEGTGLLPVVVEGVTAPGVRDDVPDSHLVILGKPLERQSTTSAGALGAQFLVWEYATAVAGRLLGINPFDQPNVAESKENTNRILDESGGGPLPVGRPSVVDGEVEIHTAVGDGEGAFEGAANLADLIAMVLRAIPGDGYLAVMAYLDREEDAEAAKLRALLAARTARPVTFGWGPRFLHSTGQFHKGGPQVGVFLQITGASETDVAIPGQPFTFGRLQMAQALGDLRALAGRGRPVVRVHLRERSLGIRDLLAAVEKTPAHQRRHG